MSRPSHGGAYPHAGSCAGCYAERLCNVCGAHTTVALGRCTNGRCRDCHARVCTSGGATEPGHGFGLLFTDRTARPEPARRED